MALQLGVQLANYQLDLALQSSEVVLNCLPNYLEVNSEIPVSQRVAHFVGVQQRKIGMGRRKLRTIAVNVSASLTDNLEIADYGILKKPV